MGCHALGADRQRQGHRGEEGFRNERHHHPDAEHQTRFEVEAERRAGNDEDQPHSHRDEAGGANETPDLTGQWCGVTPDLSGEGGDRGQPRRRRGGVDHRQPFPLRDERARVEVIIDVLVRGNALTGEDRLVDLQRVGLDDGHVGAHSIPAGQHHQVAGYQAL